MTRKSLRREISFFLAQKCRGLQILRQTDVRYQATRNGLQLELAFIRVGEIGYHQAFDDQDPAPPLKTAPWADGRETAGEKTAESAC
jgi:hypothetical protein